MSGYLYVTTSDKADLEARRRSPIGWRGESVGPASSLLISPDLNVRRFAAGDLQVIVIGEVHGDLPFESLAVEASALASRLAQFTWGRYVALFLSPAGELVGVYRDASGALECAVRTWAGGLAVSSDLPAELEDRLPAPTIRWPALAEVLIDPSLLSTADLLDGVRTVAPGVFFRTGDGPVQIWSPRGALARDPVDAPGLRSVLDGVVAEMARGRRRVLAEVSGGLDSAIVAASARAAGCVDVLDLVNVFGPYPEADERPYARAVAKVLGCDLREIARPEPQAGSALVLDHPRTLRPSLNRMDRVYDQLQDELARDLGMDAILTGKGGDVAFVQTASTAQLGDLILAKGYGALFDPLGMTLARRLRRSVWRIARAGVASAHRPWRPHPADNLLLSGDVRGLRPDPHPWLRDLDTVSPAKRQQIVGFTLNLGLWAASRRSSRATLLHPLLTQPMMEACLATPVQVLTGGGHDRRLARQAFADRLPGAVLDRRSKGELSVYYGRAIGVGRQGLRDHLLGGLLAREGLIDPVQVEAALQIEHLIWQGGYIELMTLGLMESWARAW